MILIAHLTDLVMEHDFTSTFLSKAKYNWRHQVARNNQPRSPG